MSDEACRRRRGGLDSLRGARLLQALALAGVAGLAAGFAIGAAVGGGETSFAAVSSVELRADGSGSAAGLVELGEPGDAGNVPLRLAVTGLAELPAGATYELLLTSEKQILASAGTFSVGEGRTDIHLNVPFTPPAGASWVVVRGDEGVLRS